MSFVNLVISPLLNGDVRALLNAGLLDKTEDGKIVVPYDAIHVDFLPRAHCVLRGSLARIGTPTDRCSPFWLQEPGSLPKSFRYHSSNTLQRKAPYSSGSTDHSVTTASG